jgi:hypothetical protein
MPTGPTTSVAANTSTAVATGTSNSTTNTTAGKAVTTGTTNGTTATKTGGTTGTLTNSTVSTQQNKSLSLALNDNWTETWTLDPATDPDVLRRLTALYRYVLGYSENPDDRDNQFLCDYPLPGPPTPSGSSSSGTTTTTTTTTTGTTVITTSGPEPNKPGKQTEMTADYSCKDVDGGLLAFKRRVSVTAVSPPNCVACLPKDTATDDGPIEVALVVNQNLKSGLIRVWDPNRPYTPEDGQQDDGKRFVERHDKTVSWIDTGHNLHHDGTFLGSYGSVVFWAPNENGHAPPEFREFVFLMASAVIVDSGTATGSSTTKPKFTPLTIVPIFTQ